MDTSEGQETLQAGDLDNEPHTNHYLVEKAWLSLKRHTNSDVDTHGCALLWRSRQRVQVLVTIVR